MSYTYQYSSVTREQAASVVGFLLTLLMVCALHHDYIGCGMPLVGAAALAALMLREKLRPQRVSVSDEGLTFLRHPTAGSCQLAWNEVTSIEMLSRDDWIGGVPAYRITLKSRQHHILRLIQLTCISESTGSAAPKLEAVLPQFAGDLVKSVVTEPVLGRQAQARVVHVLIAAVAMLVASFALNGPRVGRYLENPYGIYLWLVGVLGLGLLALWYLRELLKGKARAYALMGALLVMIMSVTFLWTLFAILPAYLGTQEQVTFAVVSERGVERWESVGKNPVLAFSVPVSGAPGRIGLSRQLTVYDGPFGIRTLSTRQYEAIAGFTAPATTSPAGIGDGVKGKGHDLQGRK